MYRRESISIVQENLKDLWESDVKVGKSTENESFNIVWRIMNFTMCKLQKEEYIESPIFVAECLQNSNWYLRLYPRGISDENDVVCYLFRGNSSPDSITVRYKLSVGISNRCVDDVQKFEKYSRSVVPAYARWSQILDEVCKYPLVDVLLIDCHIWNYQAVTEGSISDAKSLMSFVHNHDHNADNFPSDMLLSTMDEMEVLKRKLRPYPESCSAYTRIPVERWYFLWTINRFSERKPFEKETISVVSVSESAPKIVITFFVNEIGYLEMNIQELTKKYKRPFTVNCKIQLVSNHEHNHKFSQDMHLFTSNENWKVILHALQEDIVRLGDRFLLNDKLTFRCELAISYENEVSNIDSCNYIPEDSKLDSERLASDGCFIKKCLYSVWNHLKIGSIIWAISFLIVFIIDSLR